MTNPTYRPAELLEFRVLYAEFFGATFRLADTELHLNLRQSDIEAMHQVCQDPGGKQIERPLQLDVDVIDPGVVITTLDRHFRAGKR